MRLRAKETDFVKFLTAVWHESPTKTFPALSVLRRTLLKKVSEFDALSASEQLKQFYSYLPAKQMLNYIRYNFKRSTDYEHECASLREGECAVSCNRDLQDQLLWAAQQKCCCERQEIDNQFEEILAEDAENFETFPDSGRDTKRRKINNTQIAKVVHQSSNYKNLKRVLKLKACREPEFQLAKRLGTHLFNLVNRKKKLSKRQLHFLIRGDKGDTGKTQIILRYIVKITTLRSRKNFFL